MNDFTTDFSLPFGLGGGNKAAAATNANTRGAGYFPVISQVAKKYRVPEQLLVRLLAWESDDFDPDVVSGRRKGTSGEVGMGQFMPDTIREIQQAFGGQFDPTDPIQAIEGAAYYLAGLGSYFNGDWEKATAAYNAGAGNVEQAIRRANGADWRDHIPASTRGTYLPRVYQGSGATTTAKPSSYQDRPPDINDYPGIPDENGNMMPDYATWSQDLRAYWEAKAIQRAYETGPASQYIDDVIKELELEIEVGNLNVRKASEVLNTRIQGYKTAMDFYSSEAFKYGAPPGATHIPAGQYGSRVLGRQDSPIQGGVVVNPMQEALNVYREAQGAMAGIGTPTIPSLAANRQQATRPVVGSASPPSPATQVTSGVSNVASSNPVQAALDRVRARMNPALRFGA